MKIALLGYGKMGHTIEDIINNETDHEVSLKITSENLNELTEENLKHSDVAIEFSTPETAYENISMCLKSGVPVVSGTTGWLDKMDEVKEFCNKNRGAFFYASNFSIGVNIFFELNKHLAKLMNSQPQYGMTLHEVHHTEKKDAPSGTGITLAEGVLEQLERKTKWVKGKSEDEAELEIHSYREKDVPGIHIINYESEHDSIEIKHTAHSRKGFASGAVKAAEWIIGKQGCFGMSDMLKF